MMLKGQKASNIRPGNSFSEDGFKSWSAVPNWRANRSLRTEMMVERFAEVRLLSEFRNAGVPIVRMRPAVVALREEFNQAHPLAHALPYLEERGRELVLKVQQEVGLEKQLQLVVVRNGQLQLATPTDHFIQSVDFADSGVVQRMHPLPDLKLVWLDPLGSSANQSSGVCRPRSSPSRLARATPPNSSRTSMS